MLTWSELGHAGSNFTDNAGEFVAQCNRNTLATQGMRCQGSEGGSTEEFVKIRAADSDVARRDLDCQLFPSNCTG